MTDMQDRGAGEANGYEETIIEQDHKRGPGKFLLLSYVVISVFCLYYLFTYWNWKSDYEIMQEEVKAQLEASAGS